MPKRTRSAAKAGGGSPPKTRAKRKRKSSAKTEEEEEDQVTNGSNLEEVAKAADDEEPADEQETPKEDEECDEEPKQTNELTESVDEESSPKRKKPYDGSEEYDVDSPTKSDENLEQVSDDTEEKGMEQETEAVSEDELPQEVGKPPLAGAEAVSDEELPSMVTDNLETEAVSDEELPQEEKRKKRKVDSSKSEEGPPEPSAPDQEESKIKNLPELEKYWKAVKEDPTDFTGWTYLLQYVDQENDVIAAREAYDSFLAHYPYCYGYWRKYADYEKRKGDKDRCEEVFERGLRAIPLSVDLWLHYLNYCKQSLKENEDDLRRQFERALEVCGLEFRSDRLWESYIKWETELKNLNRVWELYDRLISTPTQNYTTHFENFEEFVMNNEPSKILPPNDYLALKEDTLEQLNEKKEEKEKEKKENEEESPSSTPKEAEKEASSSAGDELTLMREKILESKKKVFKTTVSCVLSRWNYEEGIKRPYFHVKPLERCQLNNWRDYLDYEIDQGDMQRTIILFERCLIACALYDEFWIKFIKYLETLPGDQTDKIRDVYERACTIHHPKKPILSLNWSMFEESLGNIEKAREVLVRFEKEVPNLIQVCSRRINLERRAGNLDEVCRLYEHYISNLKSKTGICTLVLKYARFCWKILRNPQRGIDILRKAIDKDKDNIRLYLQILDLTLSQDSVDEGDFVRVVDQVLENPSIDLESKALFAQRKVEFLEDFGSSVEALQKATGEYLSYSKQTKERKKKEKETEKKEEKKKETGNSTTGATTPTSNSYSQAYTQANYQQPSQNGQYTQAGGYNAQFNQYPSDQSYNNYSGWGYSHSQYGNYNQAWTGGGYGYYT